MNVAGGIRKAFLRTVFKAVLGAVLLSSAQCGKKSKDLVGEIIPAKPFVFDTAIVINRGEDDEVTVDPSWLQFRLRVTNSSKSMITLNAFRVSVFDGNSEGKSDDFVPSAIDEDSNQSVWAELAPGESIVLSDLLGNQWSFYMGGLPRPESGEMPKKFRGTITLLGWYGNQDNPEKPVVSEFTFSTQ